MVIDVVHGTDQGTDTQDPQEVATLDPPEKGTQGTQGKDGGHLVPSLEIEIDQGIIGTVDVVILDHIHEVVETDSEAEVITGKGATLAETAETEVMTKDSSQDQSHLHHQDIDLLVSPEILTNHL